MGTQKGLKAWYCAETDRMLVAGADDAFIFKDKHGYFISCYRLFVPNPFPLMRFDYVGEFE